MLDVGLVPIIRGKWVGEAVMVERLVRWKYFIRRRSLLLVVGVGVVLFVAFLAMLALPSCALRYSPSAASAWSLSDMQRVALDAEPRLTDEEARVLFSALRGAETWDIVDFNQILAGGYYISGRPPYVMLIPRALFEETLENLASRRQDDGFDTLLTYIRDGFAPDDSFIGREILGSQGNHAYIGPRSNDVFGSQIDDARFEAFSGGHALVLNYETGQFVEFVLCGSWHDEIHPVLSGRTVVTPDGTRLFTTLD